MRDNVEVVEIDSRIRQVLGRALDEGWGHVDAHQPNNFGNATSATQTVGEPCNGLNRAVFGKENCSSVLTVCCQNPG